jgi:AcrR family transcriptional regulator
VLHTVRVPRTRTTLDREAKVGEIIDEAVAQLDAGGYSALSVARIARDLGVAQNAIYWYFNSKDALFVAAVERMLRGVVARKPPRQRSTKTKVLWFVDQLAELEHVRSALRDRARESEVVARFAAELDATWRSMLINVLADDLPDPRERAIAVEALTATIQGALLSASSRAERRKVVGFAYDRLTAPS